MYPLWRADGRQLFYLTGTSMAVVDVTDPRRPGPARTLMPWLWVNWWAVDRPGKRFLRPVTSETDMVEPITVVLNWTSTLRRR
jgi:hypothetical protein